MSVGLSVGRLVHPSARPSIPGYFPKTNMAIFEDKKKSNDIKINDTIWDDEVIESDVPQRYLLDTTTYLHKRLCLSVCPSVHPSIHLVFLLSVAPSDHPFLFLPWFMTVHHGIQT